MFDIQQFWIALAIGCGLMIAGAYSLKNANPSLTTRIALGAVMLVSGIALAYPLVTGNDALELHQIQFGLAIALSGLGINQLAAPIRVAFGRPA